MDTSEPVHALEPTGARPRYDEYKYSGVDWLGDIPVHWDVLSLKYAAQIVQDKIDEKPEDLPYIGLEHIESGTGQLIKEEASEDVSSTVRHFERGDVLFSKLRPYLAKVYLAGAEGVGTTELIALRAKTEVCESYLAYQLLSKGFIDKVDSMTYGARMPRVSPEQVGGRQIALPSFEEQRAIAAFLDRETERIDALIEKKEQLIDLLEEKRTALISRVVTKGLDQGVEMQDSGVEWLGEIPAHWETVPYKYVTDRVDVGIAEAATHAYTSEGVPIIRSTNIKPNRLETDEVLYIEEWFAEKNSSKYLRAGDILTVRTGEPGTSAVVPEEFHMAQCFTLLISTLSDEQQPDFYSYFLNSEPAEQMFKLEGWGTAQTNISVPILENLAVVKPPAEEQHKIVDYLDEETSEISDLINRIKAGISSLREYRTALISAAVTGQIDVRENVEV
jgi:type I restriction enzyme S subunit